MISGFQLSKRTLLGVGGLAVALAWFSCSLYGQDLQLDSAAQAKVLRHPTLTGKARFESAIELFGILYMRKQTTNPVLVDRLIVGYLNEAQQIAQRLNRPDLESQALQELAKYHYLEQQDEPMQAVLERHRALARRIGQPQFWHDAMRTDLRLASLQGDTARVVRLARELVQSARNKRLTDRMQATRELILEVAQKHGLTRLALVQLHALLDQYLVKGDYNDIGNAYEQLFLLYEQLNEVDSAHFMLQKAFYYLSRLPARDQYAGFQLRMGNYYSSANQYSQAIASFYVSQQILDSIRAVYLQQGHVHAYQRCIDVAAIRGNMAGCYIELEQWDSSAYWLHRARQACQYVEDDRFDGYINLNLALIYDQLGRADSALNYADWAVEVAFRRAAAASNPKPVFLCCAHTLRGAIRNRFVGRSAGRADLLAAHRLVGRLRQSIPEGNDWNIYYRIRYFRMLYEQLEMVGEIRLALDVLTYYERISQNLRKDKDRTKNEVVTRIELTTRERKIEVLNLQNELNRQHLQRQYLFVGAGAVILLLALFFAWTWVRRNRERQQQNRLLETENRALNAQNAELESASEELRTALRQLNDQRQLLDVRRSHLDQSLHFATVIQQQFLGNRQHLHSWVGEHLLHYEPRDEVSGDFYWWRMHQGCLHVAVIDCTGHGVPGALMSVLAFHLLEEWFEHHPGESPAQALDFLDAAIRNTLKQERADTALDGMDVAFFQLELASGSVAYAGARRDLWLRRAGSWQRIEATRRSIGGRADLAAEPFTTHTLALQDGDRLFAFTDGVSDQFGGPRRRKLGSEALLAELATYDNLPLAEAEIRFRQFFSTWRGPHARLDDALLLGMEFHTLTFVHGT